jgi:two-component system, NtrC family, sensor kinase
VARPRRLRHKLMLGLALVVGSVGLLLGGTVYGFRAYLNTVRTTERKLYELTQVNILIYPLSESQRPAAPDINAEYRELMELTNQTHVFAAVYRDELAKTVDAGLDPDGGFQETKLLDHLEAALQRLTQALHAARIKAGDAANRALRDDPDVKAAYDEALRTGQQLKHTVVEDVGTGIRHANATIRQSLWIIVAATIELLIIVLALLYYFRQWIYSPIKELQGGVQRVQSGNFDQPIRLSSRDELEELANEFNAMTARLSTIYKDLARQVNERSRQLVRSERMVSVGFLAAGVAHEINNPLASILFCAEALERRLEEVLADGAETTETEVLTRYLKMIQQEALRCKDITQKLLDFSRSGERNREQTDLAGLIRGVLEVARHLPNCRGKNVSFNPEDYIVAPVNAQDLKSVILNLVVNALDSMDDTGSLSIQLRTKEGFAEVSFADSGCGMAADVLQNIFEPFFTRSRTGKGTGLGLFISHQIVDQHGGQIEAASAGPGHGSTFTVRIPLLEVAGEDLPAGPEEKPDGEIILPFPGKMAA